MMFLKKSELEFPSSILVGEQEFEIKVIFSKKKNSSVSVKENILSFRLSSYLSNKKALSHFDDLLNKIKFRIEKSPERFDTKIPFKVFFEKGSFIFSNENYFFEMTSKRGVKLIDNVFFVNLGMDLDLVEKNVIKLLIKKFTPILDTHIRNLNSQTYGFNLNTFSLKCLNSKWGHCSHDNNILINLRLLNSDIDILNYVIYHELCHIRHKNHSSLFWNEVSKFCPNYRELRKKLKDSPPEVFR